VLDEGNVALAFISLLKTFKRYKKGGKKKTHTSFLASSPALIKNGRRYTNSMGLRQAQERRRGNMESFLRSIKSHADEISSALSDIERHVLALEERATRAEPAAIEFEKLSGQIDAKRAELESVTAKVNTANGILASLRKQIS